MFLTRRQFLLSVPAVAAGFILPSFVLRAAEYLEKTGEPLLVPPPVYKYTLTALDNGNGDYQLNFGDPYEEPPKLTLREYIDQYYWGDDADYMEENEVGEGDFLAALNDDVDEWLYLEDWARQDSPQRIAYDYLSRLDLGLALDSDDADGAIEFIDGPCPGNDYIAVHAPDMLSLSLLQERLNQLGEEVKVEVYHEG